MCGYGLRDSHVQLLSDPHIGRGTALFQHDGDPESFGMISSPDGWSLTSSGMLVAVPESSSLPLGLGLCALALISRRRR